MEQIITALSVQKKNPNRVNVYLDGEYAFGLSRIVAAWLKIGQKLNEKEIEKLKDKDALEIITQRVYHFQSYRLRTEKEISKFLISKGYENEKIKDVIQIMKEKGEIDDCQFVEKWIENRSLNKPRGKKAITVELIKKGINREQIVEGLSHLGNEDELAYNAGKKYANRLSLNDKKIFIKKLTAFLGRRGFEYETIRESVGKIWNELQTSRELE